MAQKYIAIIALVACLPIWISILRRWDRGLLLLLCYVPFSGIPIVLSNYQGAANLIKDFAFIVPTYISYFCFIKGRERFTGIPMLFMLCIGSFFVLVVVQMFNPSLPNFLVGAIGAKVWLFYMPLVLIAYDYASSRERMIHLLRPVVALSWIPGGIGILQFILSTTIGYETTMRMFYGPAAYAATQGFARFHFGATLYRIPSTFSFPAQYFAYLWTALVLSYVLCHMDPSPKWRRFAKLTFVMIVLAAFTSGARGAFFFIPIITIIIFALQYGLKGSIKILLGLGVIAVGFSTATGFDLSKIFGNIFYLATYYARELGVVELARGFETSILGLGTGMNTRPARYAFEGQEIPLIGLENYYAKTIVELGVLGCLLLVGWQLVLIVTAFRCSRKIKAKELNCVGTALTSFYIIIFLGNSKSFRMDFDPINMYFWIFAGFLFKLNSLLVEEKQEEPPRPAEVMRAKRRSKPALATP